MLYISLYLTGEQNWPNIARWNRITFGTVAMAGYFRCPRNSITTALHYGKCQWLLSWTAQKDLINLCFGKILEERTVLYEVETLFLLSAFCLVHKLPKKGTQPVSSQYGPQASSITYLYM